MAAYAPVDLPTPSGLLGTGRTLRRGTTLAADYDSATESIRQSAPRHVRPILSARLAILQPSPVVTEELQRSGRSSTMSAMLTTFA